jgi:hypothetical protein
VVSQVPSLSSKGSTMATFGHSADVRIQLNVNGFALNVAQLGPDFITVRDALEHPPAEGEIVMSVDGKVRRWNVFLPEGISAAKPNSKITAPPAPAASKLAG